VLRAVVVGGLCPAVGETQRIDAKRIASNAISGSRVL
jgi:hypothetical protein